MIETARVVLRAWRAEDAPAHHALCHDPRVLAMFGDAPSEADSRDVVARQNALLAAHGYCFWAMVDRADGRFIGWCGLKPGHAPIDGETEIGWTVHPDRWRQGLAREAATAVLAWAWRETALPSIVAITAAANGPSQGLMARLGMQREPAGDFDDDERAPGDPLRPHILFRIWRPAGGAVR